MPSEMPNLGARATAEFRDALDRHIERIGFNGSRADYILTAIVEKMNNESDEPIPAPKAPHGIRLDARPDGWKSRLYADRYELVVDKNLAVYHLHEFGDIHSKPFPHYKKVWADGIFENKQFAQANVYIHKDAIEQAQGIIHFEDSPIGYLVRKFIENQK